MSPAPLALVFVEASAGVLFPPDPSDASPPCPPSLRSLSSSAPLLCRSRATHPAWCPTSASEFFLFVSSSSRACGLASSSSARALFLYVPFASSSPSAGPALSLASPSRLPASFSAPPSSSSHAFKLPTIYLPREDNAPRAAIPNAIDELCRTIGSTIEATVQKNLSSLKDDCDRVRAGVDAALLRDAQRRRANLGKALRGCQLALLAAVALLAGLLLAGRELALAVPPLGEAAYALVAHLAGAETARRLLPVTAAYPGLTARWGTYGFEAVVGLLVTLGLALMWAMGRAWRPERPLTQEEHKRLEGYKKFANTVCGIRGELYKEYFASVRGCAGAARPLAYGPPLALALWFRAASHSSDSP